MSRRYSKKSPKKVARKSLKRNNRRRSRKLRGGNCPCGGAPPLRSGLRLPKPNIGEAAAIGLGTYALTGSPRAGLGLGLGSYYAGRLFNTQ